VVGAGRERETRLVQPPVRTKYSEREVEKRERTLGLYSAFLACSAIVFRSSLHSRLTVATMFLLMKGTEQNGSAQGL
jgi:hypothetical protein